MSVSTLVISTVLLCLGQTGEAIGPSMVRLDFEERTLPEIVEALSKQGANRVALEAKALAIGDPEARAVARDRPENDPRRYRIHAPEPISFWEAVERISRESQRWPVLESEPEPRIVLRPSAPEPGFVSNHGAFRVVINGLNFSKRVEYPAYSRRLSRRKGEEPADRVDLRSIGGQLTVRLGLMPEPRLPTPRLVGLRVDEASDDKGQTLILPTDESTTYSTSFDAKRLKYFGTYQVPVNLKYPDDPGEAISAFRGTLSLEFDGDGGTAPVQASVPFSFTDVPLP